MSGDPMKGKALWAKTQVAYLPLSSLRTKFHSSPKSKNIRKGPAFWGNTTRARPRARMESFVLQAHAKHKWEILNKAPAQIRNLEKFNWWKISALALVAAVLIMFLILMALIKVYMGKADNMYIVIPRLGLVEKRLKEAVRQVVGNSVLACKPCEDNWLQWAGNCYLGTKEPMPWDECLVFCRTSGASLLIGKTSGEIQFLISEVRKWLAQKSVSHLIKGYWIGLMYNMTQKSWNWADGAILHLKLHIYEKTPFIAQTCVLLASSHPVTDYCASMNYCLCKKSLS